MRTRFRLALFTIALLTLTSCGHNFCVGPFGDCWRNVNDDGTGSTGILRVVPPETWTKGYLSPSEAITLTAAGGTGGYLWRIVSGGGTIVGTATTTAGTYSGDSITYTAPATTGQITFEIEDSSGAEIPYFLTVN